MSRFARFPARTRRVSSSRKFGRESGGGRAGRGLDGAGRAAWRPACVLPSNSSPEGHGPVIQIPASAGPGIRSNSPATRQGGVLRQPRSSSIGAARRPPRGQCRAAIAPEARAASMNHCRTPVRRELASSAGSAAYAATPFSRSSRRSKRLHRGAAAKAPRRASTGRARWLRPAEEQARRPDAAIS